MNVAPAQPTWTPAPTPQPVDPNKPTLPGLGTNLVAHVGYYEPTAQMKAFAIVDANVPTTVFSSVEDAVRAGAQLVTTDRAAAKHGFFHWRQDQVNGLAVLDADKGFRLSRITQPIDEYARPVRGSMFYQQYTTGEKALVAQRDEPSTQALVGATQWFDLRSGALVGPSPIPASNA